MVNYEIEKYPDKNPKRIFIGGHSHGASLAIAFYLRNDIEIGGIITAYGLNPLDTLKISTSDV